MAKPVSRFSLALCVAAFSALLCIQGARAADDLAELSDEFNDPRTASQWQHAYKVEGSAANQLQTFDISRQHKGELLMVPHASVWYQDYRGVLAFKQVTGDFVVTTRLRTAGRSGDGAPRSSFSLAGLMLRTPRDVTPQTWKPGGENYVFLSAGSADQPGQYQLEVKTTINSRSDLIVEKGEAVVTLRRPRGASHRAAAQVRGRGVGGASPIPSRRHAQHPAGRPDVLHRLEHLQGHSASEAQPDRHPRRQSRSDGPL